MLRGHNAAIHTTPKWARQRIKRKKGCRKMGATTHSIGKFPSSSGNRAQWSVRYTWVYRTENITGSPRLNSIFSNVRPGHRFVTNKRCMHECIKARKPWRWTRQKRPIKWRSVWTNCVLKRWPTCRIPFSRRSNRASNLPVHSSLRATNLVLRIWC